MAEEATEVKKKGGNKLVIIGIAVAMLFTGGFFGLKMRSAGKKPEIELGEIQTIKEFLVNIDNKTYLRTEIALHFVKGFKKEEMDASLPAIQDAINNKLAGRPISDINNVRGKEKLKLEIAAAVNKAINGMKKPEDQPKPFPHRDGWDSDIGPCVKVYFTSFAFQ